MTVRQLPLAPDFLKDTRVATMVREALQRLYLHSDEIFTQIFWSSQGVFLEDLNTKDNDLPELLKDLIAVGLLRQPSDGRLYADYLVTPWSSGAFYLTDFPDSGDRLEVFSPHPETRFFSTLLQARPGDSVLDLGTGSGILLLEAARRGATGIGIDCSERAIAFAEVNAVLNGVEQQVCFRLGDMTRPPPTEEWGKPTVVLCNPPFEPIPDDPNFAPRPLHSDAGPYGTRIIEQMLSALSRWSHRPSLFQFVLFSLGKEEQRTGEHIHLSPLLRKATQSLEAAIHFRELLRPISLKDYLVLNFGGEHGDSSRWLRQMTEEEFKTIHLLFANLYPATSSEKKRSRVFNWTSYKYSQLDDECFLWPLASRRRRTTSLAEGGEGNLYERYMSALITAREERIAGEQINLSLGDIPVQAFLHKVVQDSSVFGQDEAVIFVDLRPIAEDKPFACEALTVNEKPIFSRFTSDKDFESYVKSKLGDKGFVEAVDVLFPEKNPKQIVNVDSNQYLAYHIDEGEWSTALEKARCLPSGVVQRFLALSQPPVCL